MADGDPYAPGAMIRSSLDLLRRHPLPIAGPLLLLSVLASAVGGPGGSIRNPALALLSLVVLGALVLTSVLAWLVSVRGALDALATAGRADLGASWSGVQTRYWSGLGTLLVWGVAVGAGLLALVVPGVFLIVAWLPIVPVILAEDAVGVDALRRAWQLTEGQRWNILLLVLAVAAAGLVASALQLLPLVGSLLASLGYGLVSAFSAAWVAVYYTRRAAEARPLPPIAPPA